MSSASSPPEGKKQKSAPVAAAAASTEEATATPTAAAATASSSSSSSSRTAVVPVTVGTTPREEEDDDGDDENAPPSPSEDGGDDHSPTRAIPTTNKENEASATPAAVAAVTATVDVDPDDDLPQETPLVENYDQDPKAVAENALIQASEPTTDLEKALFACLERKNGHIARIMDEVAKLRAFISKRKQTYKRKRKEEGAPTRALSAYNIFIKERFAQLAKQNEEALKSTDTEAVMRRVPPANLVASTGNEWKELSADDKMKYEERAKEDRKRYEEQMAQYQPPDKAANRKRNKTGYNMFFSAHVLRLKATDSGVPSERGSVARLVGNAWKQLSAEEKQYYEREADKHNGMVPGKDGDDEEDDDEHKRHMMEHYQHHMPHPSEMQMHMPPPPMHMQHPPPHDPRAYYPPHMYGQPAYPHYDYSQHHQRHPASRGMYGGYPPSAQRHPYDPNL